MKVMFMAEVPDEYVDENLGFTGIIGNGNWTGKGKCEDPIYMDNYFARKVIPISGVSNDVFLAKLIITDVNFFLKASGRYDELAEELKLALTFLEAADKGISKWE